MRPWGWGHIYGWQKIFHILKILFHFPRVNLTSWQLFSFEPNLTQFIKCLPNPHSWVLFSDFNWKWHVLLFPTFLYVWFFHLGSKNYYCAKLPMFKKLLLCKNYCCVNIQNWALVCILQFFFIAHWLFFPFLAINKSDRKLEFIINWDEDRSGSSTMPYQPSRPEI